MWHGCAGRPSAGFPPRIGVRGMLLIAGITMAMRRPHKRMKMPGLWLWYRGLAPPLPVWIPAFAGMTRWVAGTYPGSESGTCFHSNRSCRLAPARRGMKSRSCGLVQRIGTADSATPHPDPSGGQAPALHFLIPPSAIGLQSGTFRPWRTGIEVDRRAHPGSESGTRFHSNRSCRLAPARQGMKMRPGLLEVFGCGWCHPSPLDSRFRGNDELRGRNDENAEWRGSTARSKAA